MQAVEFEADVKGKTIKVPDMLSGLADKHVKIILLFNDSPVKVQKHGRKFSAANIHTKNFKFNRDELYSLENVASTETFKTIREQAIAFGKEHRTFPLNWNRSKISREKMNER